MSEATYAIHLTGNGHTCEESIYIFKQENGVSYRAKPIEFEVDDGSFPEPCLMLFEKSCMFGRLQYELDRLASLGWGEELITNGGKVNE